MRNLKMILFGILFIILCLPVITVAQDNELTVEIRGKGEVLSNSEDWNSRCENDSDTAEVCKLPFDDNQEVTLVAIPAPGYQFHIWISDDITECHTRLDYYCQFTTSVNAEILAIFTETPEPNPPVLSVFNHSEDGIGRGLVSDDTLGIVCSEGLCSSEIPPGTAEITLEAIPVFPSSIFSGWAGACDQIIDETKCVIQLDESNLRSKAVTAIFRGNPKAETRRLDVVIPIDETTGLKGGEVISSPPGIRCGESCSHEFPVNFDIRLEARHKPFYKFTGWGGACSGAEPICEISFSPDGLGKTAIANFAIDPGAVIYTLWVIKQGAGQGLVISDPSGVRCTEGTCSAEYEVGTKLTLTAIPGNTSQFDGWQGFECENDSTNASTKCVFTMDGHTDIIANFSRIPAPEIRLLQVSKKGDGDGLVFSYPGGINCGEACSAEFASNRDITLVVAPDNVSDFTGWQGGACNGSTAPVCTFRLNENVTLITAEFERKPGTEVRRLSVAKMGSGDGLVTSSPLGINYGNTSSAEFSLGSMVTLRARPDPDSVFTGWEDAECEDGNTAPVCKIEITEDRVVVANFEAIAYQTVTVVKVGSGDGLVFSQPAGINCGSTCSARFVLSSAVRLLAIPADGSRFVGWQGASCSGLVCDLSVDDDAIVTARFDKIPETEFVTLTVIKTGAPEGLVFSNPTGINCGTACSGQFARGTGVSLIAHSSGNATFSNWQGGCSGTNTTCSLTLTRDTTVVANFETPGYHSLTILKIGTGSGLVYSNPSGVAWGVDIDCGSDCSTRFRHGTEIVLSAEAIGDSAFAGWGSGVCSGQGPDCTLTVNDNYTIMVEFRRITAGSLIATITPPQAIEAGARWRVNNGIWNLSGARADNLPPGSNTVEYLPVTGWNAPSPQSVIVTDGGVSTTTAHYTRATGRLKILISPPEAVRAGAQWRLNEGVWNDSGTEVSGVAGQQQLDFKPVANWVVPAGVGVLVNNGESLIQTYTYTRQVITPADNPGSITVHIAPSNIDAQWKLTGLTGDEVWRRSGETRSGLKVASAYTITFSHVGERWQRPRDIVTLLGSDATTAARQFHVNYLDLAATDCLFDWFETEYGVFFNPPSTTSAAPVDHTDLLYRCYVNTNSCVGAHETRLLYYGPLSDNTLLDAGSTAEWYHSSDCRE